MSIDTTSMYVATAPLYVGRARAYNTGDKLTPEAVERGGWHNQVEKLETPDADAPGESAFDPKGKNIETVLTYVDGDPGRAAEVLTLERAGQNRTTLIPELEAIVNLGS